MNISWIVSSLVWLGVTIGCFRLASYLYMRGGKNNLLHPIITASLGVLIVLMVSDESVEDYAFFTAPLTFLLLPATIVLAVPLYQQIGALRQVGGKVLIPILAGGSIAPSITVAVLWLVDSPWPVLASSATKSITTPLAIESSPLIGGVPSLAATMVILTGLLGASLSGWVFRLVKIRSEVAQGLALGTVAHAVGVAQAATIGPRCTGFATLALCINGVVTAIVLPLVYLLFVS